MPGNGRNKTVCMGCGTPMRRPRGFHGKAEDVRCQDCRVKYNAERLEREWPTGKTTPKQSKQSTT